MRIGQIEITGNTKTGDNVTCREIRICEGDLYSAKKIDDSLTRIEKPDFFDDVKIVVADTEQKEVR